MRHRLMAPFAILAMGLAACGQVQATPSQAPTQSGTASVVVAESPTASPTASASPAGSNSPSIQPAHYEWIEAGGFTEDVAIQMVTDISPWSGGLIAIGHAWLEGFVGGSSEPRIWLSSDGRSWTAARPEFGTTEVELRGILRRADGVIIVGRSLTAEGEYEGRGWRSSDGRAWTPTALPSDAGPAIEVASGPRGHLFSTGSALWYSVDAEHWQAVQTAPRGVEFLSAAAGEDGFVVTTVSIGDEFRPEIYASGDGRTWVRGVTPTDVGMSAALPWRGDWLSWAYTQDPATISILRSANGLDWSPVLDVNELTPADGPKAGRGMESGITEVSMSSDDGNVAMTLGWNHCCATPPEVVDVFLSTDGQTWAAAGLPEATYVTAMAALENVVVLAGHYGRGRGVIFWAAEK